MEDFTTREISVWLLMLLFLLGILEFHYSTDALWLEFILDGTINFTFIVIQIILLAGYFKILKNQNLLNVLGLGDIMFLVCSCLYFSLQNFILFYIIGIVISLLLALLLNWTPQNKTTPLAGILSIVLGGALLLQFFGILNLRSEQLFDRYQ